MITLKHNFLLKVNSKTSIDVFRDIGENNSCYIKCRKNPTKSSWKVEINLGNLHCGDEGTYPLEAINTLIEALNKELS